jgi:pyruvate,orthophosphate dikinase
MEEVTVANKNVYLFGGGSADGEAGMKNLLGGKGANLAEMARLGMPVPPGFTITTEVCTHFTKTGGDYPAGLREEVDAALRRVEELMGKKFGAAENPLLVSVRSGARASMPGMMDTVLNLGLNDTTVKGLIEASGDPRFAFDAYRRFVAMYGDVVMGLKPTSKTERDPFEVELERLKEQRGVEFDNELAADDLEGLVARFKQLVKERTGQPFPDDPMEQLWGAISAVFGSWENPRAIEYRRMYHIPASWGTAVNVQTMVFGNLGNDCATGVAFTRDPATGAKRVFGEYLVNAQGEDVVAGTRTPQPLSVDRKDPDQPQQKALEELMPELYNEFIENARKLEQHYRDMQDLEFTIEKGRLFMLQTRNGKRTGLAAVVIATDMVEEGLIKPKDAIRRIEADAMEHLLAPIFSQDELRRAEGEGQMVAVGLPAGPGAAAGKVVFHAEDAKALAQKGERVVLVRVETSPEDVGGMEAARGIVTARGGMTSHAALVARQRGKPCVVGCGALEIDYDAAVARVGDQVIKEGDPISIDGTTGKVYLGSMTPYPSEVVEAVIERKRTVESSDMATRFAKILGWADEFRQLGIRTNADSPEQSAEAIALGARGIGLCRTEHMFFEGDRITSVRRMILADDERGRRKALEQILPMQREDFKGIFRAMDGYPVTIRTLDPPLHEFLPHGAEEINHLARDLDVSPEKLRAKVETLLEANPMLGHRGCRLGNVYPEITEMQARAILEAAVEVAGEGVKVLPEIMIPLVAVDEELSRQRAIVDRVAREVFEEKGRQVDYLVGTMIELPRAALTADRIAEAAQFFSFGTNDLTQTTFGLSRDDAGRFLPLYVEQGILQADPFQTLDIDGVGQLLAIGVERGRKTRPDLKVGICGEHGGDPKSIEFAHKVKLDYVSCSPRRLPVARVAAAQAALGED